jgi:hypothetical protein
VAVGTLVVGLLALAVMGAGCARTPAAAPPTPTASPTAAAPSPRGIGQAAPEGPDCPHRYPIKGDRSSTGARSYHVPGGPHYDRVEPEECFATETDAQVAGYRRGQR